MINPASNFCKASFVHKSQLLYPGVDLEGALLQSARACAAGKGLWVTLDSEWKWWKTTRFPSVRVPQTSNEMDVFCLVSTDKRREEKPSILLWFSVVLWKKHIPRRTWMLGDTTQSSLTIELHIKCHLYSSQLCCQLSNCGSPNVGTTSRELHILMANW